jgi:hypothetical protein
MKVITLLNTLRIDADFYNAKGNAAKELLVKMTKKYLPCKAPYEQGCEVLLGTRSQLVIKVPYKLPEGWVYMEVYVDDEVRLAYNYHTFKITASWTNERLHTTPFEIDDLTHLWIDVIRDMTAALLKEVSKKDEAYIESIWKDRNNAW